MNRIYRLVWNRMRGLLQVASEFARGRTKGGRTVDRRRTRWLAGLAVVPLALPLAALAAMPTTTLPSFAARDPAPTIHRVVSNVLPTGGTVSAGSGGITQTGSTLTVTQQSQNLSLNWQSFNIGAGGTVDFQQPNAKSIAVNRIGDSNGSVILGHLNANGQVFLINPNGVLFGQGAQVNVGGLVASTLDVGDSELGRGSLHFSGSGSGRVVNRGTITATGGYVALLGPQVSNAGTLRADGGSVALAGGTAVTLSFDRNRLLSLQVDKSTLNALADNRQLIVADGGQVLMSAGARDSLLASVVNNSGTIQAQTVENRAGKIVLLGGMAAGTTTVSGTLDASAPSGGNGGFIETSAAQVKVADDASITTAAGMGLTGSWLIDPVDFTIAASGGDMTGAAVTTALGLNNFTIQSSSGLNGTAGDINVNDAVSWSSSNKLTLNAQNNINIRANLSVTSQGSLALEFGQGALAAGNTSDILTIGGVVNLFVLAHFTTKQGSDGAVKTYLVISSLGTAGSTNKKSLQGMSGSMTANYVLGANIDATATSGWNAGAGFLPIGDNVTPYTGTFMALGHTISNLTINRPSTDRVGLFGKVGTGGSVRNVGLVGGSVTGNSMVGGLVGENAYGTVSNSYATGTVTGSGYTGGLVGNNYGGAISNSYATGAVTGSSYTGGLVGNNNYGGSTISNSYASGTVIGASSSGGLAGRSNGTVSNSYASGAVSSTGSSVGGLIGYNASTISNSYASGAVSGSSSVGGLAGFNNGTVTGSFWDKTTSGQATSAGGVGMTTADMQTQANFTSATSANGNVNPAWDMANTWVMYDGHTSPLLRSFMTALTVTANNATKTYDGLAYSGGNGATYSTTPNGNLLGTLGYGGTSQSATNAGSYAISGSGLYSNQQGYIITIVDGALTVNKADLTLIGTRGYDGSSAVAGSVLTATGAAGETFAVTGAGDNSNLASKNVQTGSTLASVTGLALGTSGNGGLSSNYNALSTAGSSVSITKADLTLGTSDVTKTYDGGLTAAGTATVTSGTLFGTDAISGGSFAFTDKNAGDNKTVTTTAVTVADGNGGNNYAVTYADNTASTISARGITVDATGTNRVYDGSTNDAVSLASSGIVVGDAVSFSFSGTGTFADKNVGSGKVVTVSGISASGADAGNYSFASTASTTADISARGISVDATGSNRVYDGSTADAVSLASSGILVGDAVSFSGTGTFADKNVGSGKVVTVSGIRASGADAGNYSFASTAATMADISPATLTYVAAPASFPAGVAPTGLSGEVRGLMGGDTLSDATAGTLAWATPATSASPPGEYAIDGSGLTARNYVFVQAPGNAGALHVDNGGAATAPSASTAVIAVLAELQQDKLVQQNEIARRRLTSLHGRTALDIRIADGGVHLP